MNTIHPSRKALKNIVQNLNTAIFKTDIMSNLWLPNNIINVVDCDTDGHIYFYTTCKKNRLMFIDKHFHCTLEFNQKDFSSALRLSGVAEVIQNDCPENLNDQSCQVLLRMNVQIATYSSEKISIFNTLRDKISTFSSNFFSTEKYNQPGLNF